MISSVATSLKCRRLAPAGGYVLLLVLGLTLLFLLSLASITVGSRGLPLATVADAFFSFDPARNEHLLLRHLRLPRALLAVVVGGALGMAGAVMQALTRNPLADPGLLGVNAGATLAIVVAIAAWGITDMSDYMWFGLLGAAVAGAAVYLLGGVRSGLNPVRLVLAGAALSVVLLALTQIITVNSDEVIFDQFRHWAVGSLQGRSYDVLVPAAILILITLGCGLVLCRALDALSLGDDVAKALGVSPRRVWCACAAVVIILSGVATAAVGPVSFIGLAAPHLARLWVGPEHRRLLPLSMLISALLMLSADTLGRMVAHPDEVGVGIMVALIGGPFFVVLVRRWRLVRP
ncbi:MAG: iron ABC transporter permease [Gammaproteobacteria bacterium]|nr:iron ABC transporter permease [Gammaproteobacteria bacterium]